MGTETTLIFVAVVGARFVVPLLIPLFPLPAIVVALVLDGIDQSVFQWFGHDPPGYQSYDKAMDMFYLSVAYLSVLRNWTSRPALEVARFLFFYRLAGVVLFELIAWRPLLLIFPNTFEYFFIAYEIVRLRWNPAGVTAKRWVITAACIWVFVKLPQEWWIHVAQLDVTDTLRAHPVLIPVLALLGVALLVFLRYWLWPRLPAPAWPRRLAADPLPTEIDTAAERDRWVSTHWRMLSGATAEKVVLIGLLCVIYGEVLPGVRSTHLQMFLGIGVFVLVNTAITLAVARRTGSRESALAAFGLRLVTNAGLVLVVEMLRGELQLGNALFFTLLLSLLITLDDRFRPVAQVRQTYREPRPAAR
ncbi:hypothetical protein BJ973_004953 [Actinoplanes tereljensis]|uniref:Uncharacterized protein n=1 Tax=Paractinoplanes tereljensis TaxID=571912 RepID=A0A919NPQ1_9ACTN|nr:hypothetical protein [Actinoplanes tereljensis]GIF21602.1 hypothetical protein Ate02nite_43320 [Actinoplanes tereljensis]